MRKAFKDPASVIVTDGLTYIPGNSANNKKISELLLTEQKRFCAYTDEFISRTDARDIEHFNPKLKGTQNDNYNNWFLVKHQWNKEKSYKWDDNKPILHPTAADFEERVIYLEGDYSAKSDEDTEAKNLIALLKLDDQPLADKRKNYIKRKHIEVEIWGLSANDFFAELIKTDQCGVSYTRAIKEEFGVDVWQMLS